MELNSGRPGAPQVPLRRLLHLHRIMSMQASNNEAKCAWNREEKCGAGTAPQSPSSVHVTKGEWTEPVQKSAGRVGQRAGMVRPRYGSAVAFICTGQKSKEGRKDTAKQ